MAPSNLGQGKLARDLKEGRGLNVSKPNVSAPLFLRDYLPSARARTLSAPFLGFYTSKPPQASIPLALHPVSSRAELNPTSANLCASPSPFSTPLPCISLPIASYLALLSLSPPTSEL